MHEPTPSTVILFEAKEACLGTSRPHRMLCVASPTFSPLNAMVPVAYIEFQLGVPLSSSMTSRDLKRSNALGHGGGSTMCTGLGPRHFTPCLVHDPAVEYGGQR